MHSHSEGPALQLLSEASSGILSANIEVSPELSFNHACTAIQKGQLYSSLLKLPLVPYILSANIEVSPELSFNHACTATQKGQIHSSLSEASSSSLYSVSKK